jgi:hypothetical protein
MRAALRHRVAGDDERALGFGEERRRRLDGRAVAADLGRERVGAPRSISSSAFSTSAGSDRKTGPVGGASAVFRAR